MFPFIKFLCILFLINNTTQLVKHKSESLHISSKFNFRSCVLLVSMEVEIKVKEQPELEHMFNKSHLRKNLNKTQILLLILYFPLGILLISIRMILFVLLGTILMLTPKFYFPKWFSRAAMFLFGIIVSVRRYPNPEFHRIKTIIASNHRTAFDVFPFLVVTDLQVLIGRLNSFSCFSLILFLWLQTRDFSKRISWQGNFKKFVVPCRSKKAKVKVKIDILKNNSNSKLTANFWKKKNPNTN